MRQCPYLLCLDQPRMSVILSHASDKRAGAGGAHWRSNLLEDESINCLALLSEDLKALQHDCSRRLLCLLPLYRPLRRRQIHEVKLSRDQGHAKGQAAKSETVKALAKVSSKTNRTQKHPQSIFVYTKVVGVLFSPYPLSARF